MSPGEGVFDFDLENLCQSCQELDIFSFRGQLLRQKIKLIFLKIIFVPEFNFGKKLL